MQNQSTDPSRADLPEPVSLSRNAPASPVRRITPQRLAVAALVFTLLVVSLLIALPRPLYASANNPLIPNDCTTTVTPDPTCGQTATAAAATATANANATATATASTPPPPPSPPPTKAPTPKPRPSPAATPTTAPSPSVTASVSPTATSTASLGVGGGGSTPGPRSTPTNGPSSNGGGGSGFPLGTVLTILFVLVGLGLSVGGGWLLFRRVLMPPTETKLKPSGARPWSRTRVPNPTDQPGLAYAFASASPSGSNNTYTASSSGSTSNWPDLAPASYGSTPVLPDFGTALNNGAGPQVQGFDPAMNGGFSPNVQQFGQMQSGFDPNMQGFGANSGYNPNIQGAGQNQGYAAQALNGYGRVPGGFGTPASGFGNFSDSFVPPSPHTFSQSDTNSGSWPVPTQNGGYAPASNAFNALYGLPGDPFAASQGGNAPNWLDTLTIDQGSNSSGQQAAAPNSSGGSLPTTPIPYSGRQTPLPNNLVPGELPTNDPYLSEVVRQYRQPNPSEWPPQTDK